MERMYGTRRMAKVRKTWHMPSQKEMRAKTIAEYSRTHISRWERLRGRILVRLWRDHLGFIIGRKPRDRKEFSVGMYLALVAAELYDCVGVDGEASSLSRWGCGDVLACEDAPAACLYRKVPIVDGHEKRWPSCDVVEEKALQNEYESHRVAADSPGKPK